MSSAPVGSAHGSGERTATSSGPRGSPVATFYFVGGPTPGHGDGFFRRLAEVGGLPSGWQIYPHAGDDGRALHIVEAAGEEAILAHLALFAPFYERGPIVEVAQRPQATHSEINNSNAVDGGGSAEGGA
jgi:hypothetical protein